MSKIVILGPTDRLNRGTEALILSRISVITKFLDESTFFIPYINPLAIPRADYEFNSYKRIGLIYPSFVALQTPLIFLSVAIWSFLSNIKEFGFLFTWNEGLNVIKNTDIIVTTGGDVLSEDYGIFNFLTEFCGLFMAILLKKPVIVFAESIGPFKTRLTTFIAKSILNRVSLITTRDKISYNYIQEIGVTRPPIYLTADTAFLLDKKEVNDPTLNEFLTRKNLIGFSISDAISTWSGGNYDDYVALMANT
ncbi:polysaccharide pyruvyl transferase family protein [Methanothermobacter sp. K4]|uniref:polysaccharide pyruvyl transferase family protein n=1 Tax=Methanothermobacter sp. K4 TaxID=2913262 RepID=UPI0021023D9C|nr:polysaccharide pyruvyl transferase family protein [Methanothermobacter sp. K4]